MACVSAAELWLAAAAACCAAAVAASDATFGADIPPALRIGRAWATGIASTSASKLVPASSAPRDSNRCGRHAGKTVLVAVLATVLAAWTAPRELRRRRADG